MDAAATLKAYLDLCRVSNLPTVWSNVLAACLLAGGGRVEAGSAALVALSLSFFYLAGMALNDLCDREYDRVHRPSRPIPSGRIPAAGARRLTLYLFGAGFALLALAPHRSSLLAALLLVTAIVAYDRHHKQNPLSVLLMSSCRFLVFAVAALAVTGRLAPVLLWAGSLQFGYLVLLSLVARHENSRPRPFAFPVVPALIAGICLLDGLMLALVVNKSWIWAGIGGFVLTVAGQRYVRGD